MKNCLKNLLMAVTLAVGWLQCAAVQSVENDTVYFYETWEQMFMLEPDTMIVNPVIEDYSPYEIYLKTNDKKINKKIDKVYIAACLGDSLWVINNKYLRKNFKGDSKKLHGYIPLVFNEKMAYAINEEWFYASIGDIDFSVYDDYYYYIDFEHGKVRYIDHKALSGLLTDYPDLKMRFESMKDYKEMSIVKDYFLQYVDRVSDDVMRPEILDLVSETIKR